VNAETPTTANTAARAAQVIRFSLAGDRNHGPLQITAAPRGIGDDPPARPVRIHSFSHGGHLASNPGARHVGRRHRRKPITRPTAPDLGVEEQHGSKQDVHHHLPGPATGSHGVNVYDPNTGQVRSNGTDQVALWMIDTEYNEESFFVRHCYFTCGQAPYARLKRALKADIDEDAWESLHRTESRPFPRPDTGKIAVRSSTTTATR